MSNLLQKASIVTTPTAYGVGVLNSIKPAYALGNNLLTQNWTTTGDWVFTNNGTENAILSKTTAVATNCRQTNIGLVSNRTYKLEFTISVYNSGSLAMKFGGGAAVQIENESVGKFSLDLLNDGTVNNIQFQGTFQGTIEQIRLREITDADFDFARTSSATRVNPDYLIETVAANTPRLDYTNGVAQILVENASTNLLPYSSDFSQWSLGSGTTVESGYLSPDGTNNAYKVSGGGGALSFAASANQTQTRTIYAKTVSGTGQAHLCSYFGNTNNLFTITDQWQRFEINGTTTPTGSATFYGVDFRGSTNLSEILIFGAMLEESSYATSYIPTSGSTVTRAAETLNNAGNSDLINSTEGTLYCEIAALSDDGTRRDICISNGTSNNVVRISFHSVLKTIRGQVRADNVLITSLPYVAADTKDFHKIALSYNSSRARLFVDGVNVGLDTSVTLPTGLNTLEFTAGGAANRFYGKCKTVAVFKEELSESEMACLTSTGNREIFLNYYYRMHYVGANIEALSCAEKTFNI
jgi:hypothetical protein